MPLTSFGPLSKIFPDRHRGAAGEAALEGERRRARRPEVAQAELVRLLLRPLGHLRGLLGHGVLRHHPAEHLNVVQLSTSTSSDLNVLADYRQIYGLFGTI